MMPENANRTPFRDAMFLYLVVYGKLPRKRKTEMFEFRISSHSEGETKVKELIAERKIRVEKAWTQYWRGSELYFVDSDGKQQTIEMRNLFPSSEPNKIIWRNFWDE